MPNVIAMQRRIKPADVKEMLAVMRSFWVNREIETDAYFLGVQVLWRMQFADRLITNWSMDEANTHAVEIKGGIYAGACCKDMHAFILAMQQLHMTCGILSGLKVSELDEVDAHLYHFTRDPSKKAYEDWNIDTPIWFTFNPAKLAELREACTAGHKGSGLKIGYMEIGR